MIDRRVPGGTVGWSGTGTVVVEPSRIFRMIAWLPRTRDCSNPCCRNIAQISRPDSTRSLPNGNLDRGHVHFATQPPFDLFGAGLLEEQFECLDEVRAGLLDGLALAGDVEL